MTIYEKLQSVRDELSKANLKKTGKNSYASYEYFELADFLPSVTALCMKHKCSAVFSMNADMSTLTIVDSEKPDDKIHFEMPTGKVEMKGAQPIQQLGAVRTYMMRYLYSNAFEIAENDALDATMGKETSKQQTGDQPKAQTKAKAQTPAKAETASTRDDNLMKIAEHAKRVGMTASDVSAVINFKYKKSSSKELTDAQVALLTANLEKYWADLIDYEAAK